MSNMILTPQNIPSYLLGTTSAALEAYSKGLGAAFDVPVLQKTRDKQFKIVTPGGDARTLTVDTEQGTFPLKSINAVILGINNGTNGTALKAFWESGYSDENAGTVPDCHSSNGVSPDADSRAPQALKCQGCINNWQPGSSAQPKCKDNVYLALLLVIPQADKDVTIYRLKLAPSDYVISINEKGLNAYMGMLRGVGVGPEYLITTISYGEGDRLKLEFAYKGVLPEEKIAYIKERQGGEDFKKALAWDKKSISEAQFIEQAKESVKQANVVPMHAPKPSQPTGSEQLSAAIAQQQKEAPAPDLAQAAIQAANVPAPTSQPALVPAAGAPPTTTVPLPNIGATSEPQKAATVTPDASLQNALGVLGNNDDSTLPF